MIPVDQRKADMEDPYQHFGWALSLFPVREDGTPMILPILSLMWVSKHLWDCGFRHHPELQTICQEVAPGMALSQAGVSWVPCDGAPAPVPTVDLSNISDAEAAAVQAALDRRNGGVR